jgi:hypothetical protein
MISVLVLEISADAKPNAELLAIPHQKYMDALRHAVRGWLANSWFTTGMPADSVAEQNGWAFLRPHRPLRPPQHVRSSPCSSRTLRSLTMRTVRTVGTMDRSSVLVVTNLVVESAQKKNALLGAPFTCDKGLSPILIAHLCKVGLTFDKPWTIHNGLCKVCAR